MRPKTFLDALTLRAIAADLVGCVPVPLEALASFGQAYLDLEAETTALRVRQRVPGRRTAVPVTDDARLVLQAREALAMAWRSPCSLTALASRLGVTTPILSRCNGVHGIPLSPALRGQIQAIVEGGAVDVAASDS